MDDVPTAGGAPRRVPAGRAGRVGGRQPPVLGPRRRALRASSTATSSAAARTATWSGVRRACASPRPGCWATCTAGTCSTSAAAAPSPPAGWPSRGARVVGFDLSAGMLRAGGGRPVPLVQADATRLPFADAAFDLACSAYGAVPFVDDPARVMREVARVLRPGGRWVFSLTHPVRWAFPDDPGENGLTATPLVLRPHAVPGDRRGRHRHLRRAPPHARRPGPRPRRRRVRAGRPGRAGVARGSRPGVGWLEPVARPAAAGDGRPGRHPAR